MDQPRSRAIPALSLGNAGGNGESTQPDRFYTHHADTKRTSSTTTSTYELSGKAWSLSDPPNRAINRAFPQPPRASYDIPALPSRRVITEKNRWVCLTQHYPASLRSCSCSCAPHLLDAARSPNWSSNCLGRPHARCRCGH